MAYAMARRWHGRTLPRVRLTFIPTCYPRCRLYSHRRRRGAQAARDCGVEVLEVGRAQPSGASRGQPVRQWLDAVGHGWPEITLDYDMPDRQRVQRSKR
jgi:hypothetical protein